MAGRKSWEMFFNCRQPRKRALIKLMDNAKRLLSQKIPKVIVAIIFMLTAGIFITFMQTGVKLLSDELHPFVIVFFRAFLVLFILLPAILYKGKSSLETSSYGLQITRGLFGGSGMVCVFYGLSLVPLAEATTLLFTVPIFATLLSIIFLKEAVGIRRWTAILFGFAGTIVVMRPDIAISLGHMMLLYAAFAWSVCVLIAKKLTQSDSVLSITFWQAVGSAPIGFILCLYVWQWPDLQQLLYLFCIAGFGTAGHLLMYAALQRGAVSFILPLDYLRIIWSTAIGIFIFADVPSFNLYIGGALIISATSFITFREVKLRRKEKPIIAPPATP